MAVTVFALALFGVVMVYSAGAVIANKYYQDVNVFLVRQGIALAIGVVAMVFVSQIDFSLWRRLALPIFLLSLLLVAPMAMHLVKPIGGAYRWFQLGKLSFQPSEFLKLGLIIYLAALFEKRRPVIKEFFKSSLPFFGVMALITILIMREPDLGTLLILIGVGTIMYFVAGANLRHLLVGIGLAVGLIFLLIFSAPYRAARLESFLNPSKDVQGIGYHNNQALIAIGTGGLFGKGFGQSIQKQFYLPEPHTDSIFAITVEELGFIRTSMIMLAFLVIIWRGFVIVRQTKDEFGRLLALGVISWILLQSFINIAAMLRLVPLTGVPLPLLSYGGSSLIFILVAVGILLNVSKNEE